MFSSALMFGAIGVLAETSDIQRRAFNAAFEEHALYWHWDEDTYALLLEIPGGKARINYFATAQGIRVDIDAIYEAKVKHFAEALERGVPLRPGVADMIAAAKSAGMKIALASSTDPRQVAAVLRAVSGELRAEDFDFIGDRTQVEAVKPAPDIYHLALAKMGVAPQNALAIEDTPESAASALAAGIATLGFAGLEAAHRDFPLEVMRVDRLEPEWLQGRWAA